MDTLQRISSLTDRNTYTYNFFFSRFACCLSKGRGFSLFHANQEAVTSFSEGCSQRGYSPLLLKLSSLENELSKIALSPRFVILVQDLSYEEFLEQASTVADKIVFPLWFKRIPVCFFSYLDRGAYENQTTAVEDLHRNPLAVVNVLLAEQIIQLLERSNYQFTSPAFLPTTEHQTIFTPIEEKLLTALEAHQLPYQAQAPLGRSIVDFLVGIQNNKVIVECDGNIRHDGSNEAERDKLLSRAGYPICRFSGADIDSGVELCIETIQKALCYEPSPSYALDNDLDSSQQAAVASIHGPTRVLAPAGSGKTKTLVNRILNLLNHGIPPERILALAFNKKARDEMQERLERRGVEGAEVRTFHSLGYEIVREKLGWEFQGSTAKKTAKVLMKSAILEHTELPALRNKDPLDAFMAGLHKAKADLPVLSTVTVEYGDLMFPFESIFYSFIKKQLDKKFLDFDDMIYLAIRVLLESSSLRQTYQSKFEYVLVDEFQDLNQAQLLLLQILSLPENNIFAVGDDDQMIYGFRGANVKHMIQFDKRFPAASDHVLNTNYRSSRMIVRHAGWLISHNTDRISKNIQPRPNAQLGGFEVSGHSSLYEQAKYAAEWLVKHRQDHHLNWRDYAILYRFNAFQFPVGMMLDAMNIPHTPLSGEQLFQTSVGVDVYSYLKIILFPKEATAPDLARLLKRPNKYFSNQLIAQATSWNSLIHLAGLQSLRTWEQEKLIELIGKIEVASKQARAPGTSAIDLMKWLAIEFGLEDFYRDQARKSDDLDQASDDVLFDVITAFVENFKTPLDFYKHICKSMDDAAADSGQSMKRLSSKEREPERNEVYLSTIHRAKGKEFRNVIYFNLSQADKKATNAESVEEERRVAYVGATRPKDDLLITFSTTKPSAFLREVSLNPKFQPVSNEDLKQGCMSCTRQIQKEQVVLAQMEAKKNALTRRFDEMTKHLFHQKPDWLAALRWRFQNRRIRKLEGRIESIDRQIKKQLETKIEPLCAELREIEEEQNIRTALRVTAQV
jgi:DNA helicase II / ATP-dependent DNA helicase PcrA